MADILTISKYLKGVVRGIIPSDEAIQCICADAEVEAEMDYTAATKKQKDLSLAYLYKWIASPVIRTGGYSEEDADWKSSENGEQFSAKMLEKYIDMANDIFEEYDLPLIGDEYWGFVGRGFSNPRKKNSNR